MLLARRQVWWLSSLVVAFVSCNEETVPSDVAPTPTSVIVTPEAFLGDVACGTEPGGLLTYQVTLLDVTDGLHDAPTLTSSPVVDCTSTVVFETVEIGRRYAATIRAFDQDDVQAEREGSQTVVDPEGNEVLPSWTTLCTGHDGEIDEAFGGAGGQASGEGGAVNLSLGVLAVEHAAVPIRGCAPLSGAFDPNLTGVRVRPSSFLAGLSCGQEAGQVSSYSVGLIGDEAGVGGMGGQAGSGNGGSGSGSGGGTTPCAEDFVLRGLPGGEWITLEVFAFEAGESGPSWSAICDAHTQSGAVLSASCGRLRPL